MLKTLCTKERFFCTFQDPESTNERLENHKNTVDCLWCFKSVAQSNASPLVVLTWHRLRSLNFDLWSFFFFYVAATYDILGFRVTKSSFMIFIAGELYAYKLSSQKYRTAREKCRHFYYTDCKTMLRLEIGIHLLLCTYPKYLSCLPSACEYRNRTSH